jgi:hypothetical protein
MGNVPDVAFVQEYVGRAKAFRRWAYRGTPDIRIIVFNKVPVMAMLRFLQKNPGDAPIYIREQSAPELILPQELVRAPFGTESKLYSNRGQNANSGV